MMLPALRRDCCLPIGPFTSLSRFSLSPCLRSQIGDRVNVDIPSAYGLKRAEVMYIGKLPIAPGYWIGVRYDEPVGKNDGSVMGERFFECPMNFGGFIRPNIKNEWAEHLRKRSKFDD